MKKLIFILAFILGIGANAQSFDFSCIPNEITLIRYDGTEYVDHVYQIETLTNGDRSIDLANLFNTINIDEASITQNSNGTYTLTTVEDLLTTPSVFVNFNSPEEIHDYLLNAFRPGYPPAVVFGMLVPFNDVDTTRNSAEGRAIVGPYGGYRWLIEYNWFNPTYGVYATVPLRPGSDVVPVTGVTRLFGSDDTDPRSLDEVINNWIIDQDSNSSVIRQLIAGTYQSRLGGVGDFEPHPSDSNLTSTFTNDNGDHLIVYAGIDAGVITYYFIHFNSDIQPPPLESFTDFTMFEGRINNFIN